MLMDAHLCDAFCEYYRWAGFFGTISSTFCQFKSAAIALASLVNVVTDSFLCYLDYPAISDLRKMEVECEIESESHVIYKVRITL